MMHERMMKRGGVWMAAVALGLLTAGQALAIPMPVPLTPEDYANLGVVGEETALVVSNYNYNNIFTGTVTSRAYELASGDYLYLYQADNAGPSVLEILALRPFYVINAAGYLTANEPAGFLAGGDVPLGMTWDQVVQNVSYNYPSWMGAHVAPGDHTASLYIVSPHKPTIGEAYVIDSGTAVAEVVVPVPEPTALALVVLGAAAVVARRRRR